MRLFALISTIALAAALNQKEVNIIDTYGQKYGGGCYTLEVEDNGNSYQIESTGIPNHPTYTTNPNDVQEQAYSYSIPKNPTIAASQSCVPMGEIGFALNGVPFYNPLSGPDSNAVQGSGAETFDGCGGHPARMGRYHYHELPSLDCIFHDNVLSDDGNGTLIGVALDGFPIYYWKEAANVPEFEELLDDCHGTSSLGGTYRYYITKTFPYVLGCFKGAVSKNQIVDCPSFNGEEKALCSCPMMGPPARPSRQLQQSSASILRYDDITDSECRYMYDCDVPMSTHLWCHTTEIRPVNCDVAPDHVCPAKTMQRPGQNGQYGQPLPGQQQPGQQQPGQQQPGQQQPGQQQPSQQWPGQQQPGQQQPGQQQPGQQQPGQQRPGQQRPGQQQPGQQQPGQQQPGQQQPGQQQPGQQRPGQQWPGQQQPGQQQPGQQRPGQQQPGQQQPGQQQPGQQRPGQQQPGQQQPGQQRPGQQQPGQQQPGQNGGQQQGHQFGPPQNGGRRPPQGQFGPPQNGGRQPPQRGSRNLETRLTRLMRLLQGN